MRQLIFVYNGKTHHFEILTGSQAINPDRCFALSLENCPRLNAWHSLYARGTGGFVVGTQTNY